MEKENKEVTPSTESQTPAAAKAMPQKAQSNESFLGSILVFILVILLLGVLGFFTFLGYRVWKQNQVTRNAPSIDHLAIDKNIPLPTAQVTPEANGEGSPTTPVATGTAPTTTVDKSTLQLKVLNGGAAKGTAGTYAETLRKAGYTKVTLGNSIGDYTGASIYYAKGKNVEADTLKVDVAKTYPKVTTLEAPAADKDANAAMLVLILGK